MTEDKIPNPIDVHVGARVRLRRLLLGLSQDKLGEQLGVTFQQVQKYERGANRIGASRLFEVSRVLGVPVAFFYEGLDAGRQGGFAEGDQTPFVSDFLTSSEGVALAVAFSSIRSTRVRRELLNFVRALADEQRDAVDA